MTPIQYRIRQSESRPSLHHATCRRCSTNTHRGIFDTLSINFTRFFLRTFYADVNENRWVNFARRFTAGKRHERAAKDPTRFAVAARIATIQQLTRSHGSLNFGVGILTPNTWTKEHPHDDRMSGRHHNVAREASTFAGIPGGCLRSGTPRKTSATFRPRKGFVQSNIFANCG